MLMNNNYEVARRWSGTGGSGIVIVRYVIPPPPKGAVFMMRYGMDGETRQGTSCRACA
jgi:hypothetical protein